MRCPACGNDEPDRDICSQCHTSLVAADDSSEFEDEKGNPSPSPTRPVKTPAPPSKKNTPIPPEGKHRPRPLHDLDLTLPELDVQSPPQSKSNSEILPTRSPGPAKPGKPSAPTHRNPPPKPGNQTKPAPRPSETSRPPEKEKKAGEASLDFSSYVLSIGTAALMALGGAKMPGMPSSQASGPKDIAQGKELFELLLMLEEKTEGNLTNSESELLKQTIHNLRNKLAQATKPN